MSTSTQDKKASKKEAKNEIVDPIANGSELGAPSLPVLGEVVGDFDTGDMSFTELKIAQAVGPLADDYNKGDVVIGDSTDRLKVSGIGDDPLEITVMKLTKSFVEDVPYGGKEIARTANTKEEVYAMEGTLSWSKDENGNRIKPTWKPLAEAVIAIKEPEGVDEVQWFPYRHMNEEEEIENYALATWKIRGTAYYAAVDPIVSAAKTYMRSGLMYGSFNMSTDKRTFGANNVAIPVIKRGKQNTQSFVEWLAEFV